MKPELTEGPYYVDPQLERSDIRSDPATGVLSEGLPLAITFLVSSIDGSACGAFEGALVDVWHCDAQGIYSGVQDPRFDTSDQAFLRGYQIDGRVRRGHVPDDLPGLVQRTRRPHPFQDPDRPG